MLIRFRIWLDVRDIAAFMYDKKFHLWRETAWVYLPWDQVNSELYNDAMHLGLQTKLNQNGKLLSNKTMPKTFQRPPFPNKTPNEGGDKNTHTATILTTIKANVKEDKIVNTPMCVKNVEGHILDRYAQMNEEPNFSWQTIAQNKLVHLINKLDNNSVVTPIKVDKFEHWLQGYNTNEKGFLIKGFKFGFSIPYCGHRKFRYSKNLKSANDNPSILKEKKC